MHNGTKIYKYVKWKKVLKYCLYSKLKFYFDNVLFVVQCIFTFVFVW